MSATLRNIAIIAHVDHGKTTMIDRLLAQSGAFRDNQKVAERAMDSNDLEHERGITILAKVTSLVWKDTRINIVDTPGHADFGGEVERILNMVDGAVLLVDAAEGPMPQTKFVLQKALKIGLKPIVAINKIDRADERRRGGQRGVRPLRRARCERRAARFPDPLWIRQAGLDGREAGRPAGVDGAAVRSGGPPCGAARRRGGPFRMLVTTIEANPFLGRVLTGRIRSGSVKADQTVKAMARDGKLVERGRVSKVLAFRGLERQPVDEGQAGDIVAIAGLATRRSPTRSAMSVSEPIAAQPIDPPTLTMTFRINDGPLAGKEGDKVQSRVIRDRLFREAEGNVALKVTEGDETDAFEVAGRGELQLGILIETMRREGFELTVGRPRVVFRARRTAQRLEPIEEVIVDVDEEYRHRRAETVERRAEMKDMRPSGAGRQRIVFHPDPRPHRLSAGAPVGYARHRDHEPHLPCLCAVPRRDSRPPYRRPHLQRRWRSGRLCDLQSAGPRADVHRSGHEGLCRHDHRRAHARQRPRDQRAEGQEAHQRPRRRQG